MCVRFWFFLWVRCSDVVFREARHFVSLVLKRNEVLVGMLTYREKVVNIYCHFSLMQIGRMARRRAALVALMARWSHCVRVVSEGAVDK